MHRERFAPSPTGELHLGGAFSALTVHGRARAAGGVFLVRMEDIDRGRARPEYAAQLLEDLAWLGLVPDEPVLYQSTRRAAHLAALDRLAAAGLTYPCTCTRRDIAAAASAPQEQANGDLDGPPYPGTCRGGSAEPDRPYAVRLDMARAIVALGGTAAVRHLGFEETGEGPQGETGRIALDPAMLIDLVGDIVLWRKDDGPSYHLAVVVDDAFQNITTVTRGGDLFGWTAVHRLLQALLGLPVPAWHHHRLIRDGTGRRLAKRDDDRSIRTLREAGLTPADIKARVGL